jgi:hypothetical protein
LVHLAIHIDGRVLIPQRKKRTPAHKHRSTKAKEELIAPRNPLTMNNDISARQIGNTVICIEGVLAGCLDNALAGSLDGALAASLDGALDAGQEGALAAGLEGALAAGLDVLPRRLPVRRTTNPSSTGPPSPAPPSSLQQHRRHIVAIL